jgi:hypothetical protein
MNLHQIYKNYTKLQSNLAKKGSEKRKNYAVFLLKFFAAILALCLLSILIGFNVFPVFYRTLNGMLSDATPTVAKISPCLHNRIDIVLSKYILQKNDFYFVPPLLPNPNPNPKTEFKSKSESI